MSESFDRLTREVGETRDAVNAAAGKIGEQSAEIRRLGDIIAAGQEVTPEQLNAVSDQLDQMQADLAAAGNPPPPPPPEPVV